MSKGRGTLSVQCPVCEESFSLGCAWVDDPGRMYTRNGDGWPPERECAPDPWPDACPECRHPWTAEEEAEVERRVERAAERFFDERVEW